MPETPHAVGPNRSTGEGMGTGSEEGGRSMNLCSPEEDWQEARRLWNEGSWLGKTKQDNHMVEEGAGVPEGKKSKEVILKRTDPKDSNRDFRGGSQGAESPKGLSGGWAGRGGAMTS